MSNYIRLGWWNHLRFFIEKVWDERNSFRMDRSLAPSVEFHTVWNIFVAIHLNFLRWSKETFHPSKRILIVLINDKNDKRDKFHAPPTEKNKFASTNTRAEDCTRQLLLLSYIKINPTHQIFSGKDHSVSVVFFTHIYILSSPLSLSFVLLFYFIVINSGTHLSHPLILLVYSVDR